MRGLPRAAALLVGLEGVLLVAIGLILLGYALAGHRPADAVSFGFVVGFSLLTGVGLLAAGRGLLHRRHMARAPAVLTQLFCIPVGANMLHSVPYAGIPLIVLGVVGLVLLFAPATTHALGD